MSFIKKIRIKNFKNLEDVEIEVKPLTFLFGPNGSGKSSFIKAMMFLSKNLFPLNTGKTIYKISDDVDLGGYESIVINGDVKKNIEFEFDVTGQFEFPKIEFMDEPNFGSIFNYNWQQDKFLSYDFDITYSIVYQENEYSYYLHSVSIEDNLKPNLYEFYQNYSALNLYDFEVERLGIINEEFENEDSKNSFLDEWDISKEHFLFQDNNSISELLNEYFGNIDAVYDRGFNTIFKPDFDFMKFISTFSFRKIYENDFNRNNDEIISEDWEVLSDLEKESIFYESLKFSYLTNVVAPKHLLEFFNYKHLPLVRQVPQKKYLKNNNEFDQKDYHGLLNYIHELKTSLSPALVFSNINNYLNILGYDYKFIFSTNNDVGSIILKNEKEEINLTNASSGLIQIIPILICCSLSNLRKQSFFFQRHLMLRVYSTLLIEQPELHLHPKLQSQLAVLFSDTVKDSDNNLFVETHSEHLIRKIQVLIANGELDREKVSVLYFDNKDSSTKVEEMKIDDKGLFIKDWPDGFFDDSINLTMELYEALRKNKN